MNHTLTFLAIILTYDLGNGYLKAWNAQNDIAYKKIESNTKVLIEIEHTKQYEIMAAAKRSMEGIKK